MAVTLTQIKNILTRTSGYLKTVTSHSLQPYRGCTFGNSLCGVGCYVQHNGHLTLGRPWGAFLEVRENGAESYRAHAPRERRWAQAQRRRFSIFMSSATDPFVPQEFRHGVTRSLLEAMLTEPPDALILQTHSHRSVDYLPLIAELSGRCDLRFHLSIETDRERIPGLPPPASSVSDRMATALAFRERGVWTVATVSPLLSIADPDAFFSRLAEVADAVVLDHFIEGDGTADGRRTLRTALPAAMASLDPASLELGYRDRMAAIAEHYLPGRVGISISGFAGHYSGLRG